ncbi:MAG: DNA methyltransferase [Candidatus Heimdallarchaeota archaeon]
MNVQEDKPKPIPWLNKVGRICECNPKHLNCLSGKEWVKAMVGVWEFTYEARDIRDKNIHPAVFPLALARRVIEVFTHRGEVVLDPFNGTGTTLLACQDTQRHGIGIDLNPAYCQLARERVTQGRLTPFLDSKGVQPYFEVICADAHHLRQYLPDNSIDLVFTSPPYANILDRERTSKSLHTSKRKGPRFKVREQYSDDPRDLGLYDPDSFVQALNSIFAEIYHALKPQKRCVINVRDVVPYFLHISIIETLQQLDFTLRNILIWNKKAQIQRLGIFGYPSNFIALNSAYEYILDFQSNKDE